MAKQGVGLIGLGNAGRPLGERLLAKGYALKAYDIDRDAVQALAKAGAAAAASAAAAVSDVTLLAVPSSVEVRQAVFGPSGVLETIRPGQIVIDLSGTDPDCARELQERLGERGAQFLGATLHADGAPAVTIPKGLLSIVIGGDRQTLDSCSGLLKELAQKVVYVPEPWIPKAIKIAVIMLTTANTIMLAEICAWLEAQRIDPHLFLDVQHITGSEAANGRIGQFFKRGKSYGGALSNSYKDLHQALSVAAELRIPLPFTAVAHQIQEMGSVQGFQRLNSPAAIGKLYELLTGVSLARATMENPERAFPEPKEPEIVYL